MNNKMEELEKLLGKGFDIEEITSDTGVVEIVLSKANSTRVVTLSREDAADILWGAGLPETRRTVNLYH